MDAHRKRHRVQRADGRLVFEPRGARDELPTHAHEQRRDHRPAEQSQRREPEKNRAHRQPRQQRMAQCVGQQREPPQDDERAQKTVGETHQHATQKGALHELVMERLGQPMERREREDGGGVHRDQVADDPVKGSVP